MYNVLDKRLPHWYNQYTLLIRQEIATLLQSIHSPHQTRGCHTGTINTLSSSDKRLTHWYSQCTLLIRQDVATLVQSIHSRHQTRGCHTGTIHTLSHQTRGCHTGTINALSSPDKRLPHWYNPYTLLIRQEVVTLVQSIHSPHQTRGCHTGTINT